MDGPGHKTPDPTCGHFCRYKSPGEPPSLLPWKLTEANDPDSAFQLHTAPANVTYVPRSIQTVPLQENCPRKHGRWHWKTCRRTGLGWNRHAAPAQSQPSLLTGVLASSSALLQTYVDNIQSTSFNQARYGIGLSLLYLTAGSRSAFRHPTTGCFLSFCKTRPFHMESNAPSLCFSFSAKQVVLCRLFMLLLICVIQPLPSNQPQNVLSSCSHRRSRQSLQASKKRQCFEGKTSMLEDRLRCRHHAEDPSADQTFGVKVPPDSFPRRRTRKLHTTTPHSPFSLSITRLHGQ